ncbi:MAG: N-acetyltransferase [Elusimicrobia bacterium]|nr:N-acetyltransferase [Elusimicrobiota bacterium]
MPNHIHPTASIGTRTDVGFNAVILENAVIGEGCRIGHGVVIHPDTVIGRGVRIDDNAVVGKSPMRSSLSAMTQQRKLDPCVIGDGCILGSMAVVYRGCRIGRGVMVADFASIREDVEIGELTIVGRGVAVENKVKIGRKCKLETGSYITALSGIEDGCFVAPEVTFTNDNFVGRTAERFKFHKGVTLRRGARVGANSTILPRLTVGADALVAAGSLVRRNVPARKIVAGAPAKIWRDVPKEQLLDNQ